VADVHYSLVKELAALFGEFFAILHYFSDFIVAVLIYGLFFENGVVGPVFVWFVVGLTSAVLAELLKSKLPTPLRIVLHRR